jgi:hypothetical protein
MTDRTRHDDDDGGEGSRVGNPNPTRPRSASSHLRHRPGSRWPREKGARLLPGRTAGRLGQTRKEEGAKSRRPSSLGARGLIDVGETGGRTIPTDSLGIFKEPNDKLFGSFDLRFIRLVTLPEFEKPRRCPARFLGGAGNSPFTVCRPRITHDARRRTRTGPPPLRAGRGRVSF